MSFIDTYPDTTEQKGDSTDGLTAPRRAESVDELLGITPAKGTGKRLPSAEDWLRVVGGKAKEPARVAGAPKMSAAPSAPASASSAESGLVSLAKSGPSGNGLDDMLRKFPLQPSHGTFFQPSSSPKDPNNIPPTNDPAAISRGASRNLEPIQQTFDRIDTKISQSPTFQGIVGAQRAASAANPVGAAAEIAVGGAASALTGGTAQSLFPQTTGQLANATTSGNDIIDKAMGVAGSTGVMMSPLAPVALGAQAVGTGVRVGLGQESPLAGLGDVALTAAALPAFKAASAIPSMAKRIGANIGVSEGLDMIGGAIHGDAPTVAGAIGAAASGAAFGVSSHGVRAVDRSSQDFVQRVTPAAQIAAEKTGLPVEFIVGQWAHETTKDGVPGNSYAAKANNNLAGIKPHRGRPAGEDANYAGYSSLEEFANGYADVINQPRYAEARKAAEDGASYGKIAKLLQKAGYAEDKQYGYKVGARAAALENTVRSSAKQPLPERTSTEQPADRQVAQQAATEQPPPQPPTSAAVDATEPSALTDGSPSTDEPSSIDFESRAIATAQSDVQNGDTPAGDTSGAGAPAEDALRLDTATEPVSGEQNDLQSETFRAAERKAERGGVPDGIQVDAADRQGSTEGPGARGASGPGDRAGTEPQARGQAEQSIVERAKDAAPAEAQSITPDAGTERVAGDEPVRLGAGSEIRPIAEADNGTSEIRQSDEPRSEVPAVARPEGVGASAIDEQLRPSVPPERGSDAGRQDRPDNTEGRSARAADRQGSGGNEDVRLQEAQGASGEVRPATQRDPSGRFASKQKAPGADIEVGAEVHVLTTKDAPLKPKGSVDFTGEVLEHKSNGGQHFYLIEDFGQRTWYPAEELRAVGKPKPVSQRPLTEEQQRSQAWQEIQGAPAASPRDYILRDLAGDRGRSSGRMHLSRRDANEHVFGSHFTKAEQHRNYLRVDGLGFDSYLHDVAIPDFYGREMDARELSDVSHEWRNTLHDIVQSIGSSKEAREHLIDQHLKAQQPPDAEPSHQFAYTDHEPHFPRAEQKHPGEQEIDARIEAARSEVDAAENARDSKLKELKKRAKITAADDATMRDPDTVGVSITAGELKARRQRAIDKAMKPFEDRLAVAKQEADALIAGRDAAIEQLRASAIDMFPEDHLDDSFEFGANAAPAKGGLTPPGSLAMYVVPGAQTVVKDIGAIVRKELLPVLRGAVQGSAQVAGQVQRTLAPSSRGEIASLMKGIMRGNMADFARKSDVLHESMKKISDEMDKLPTEAKFDFMDRMERGKEQVTPELETIASALRAVRDDRVAQVRKLGVGKLKQLIENYFPHIWKDPAKAEQTFRDLYGTASAHRPMEGDKSWTKQRVIEYISDGRAKGLELVSNNPVELMLLRVHQMDKFIMAHNVMNEAKAQGLAKFRAAFEPLAEGEVKINDSIGTVYGNPEITLKEYTDKSITDAMNTVIDRLGIRHDRKYNAGRDRLGYAERSGDHIVSQYATGEEVVAHELGHALDFKYDLWQKMLDADKQLASTGRKTGPITKELRALADERLYGDETQHKKNYVRNRYEKMAVMLQAYVHAPDLFKRVAPTTYGAFRDFLDSHEDLHELRDVKPDLRYTEQQNSVHVPGMIINGYWVMPEQAATLVNNYLSPGLRYKSAAFRGYLALANSMNAFQLGWSGFHLGFVTMDAMTSRMALGIYQVGHGSIAEGAKNIVSAPAAPIQAYSMGNKMMKEWLKPGSQGEVYGKLVNAMVQAGGRAKMDEFYRIGAWDRMKEAWRDSEGPIEAIFRAGYRLPLALTEKAMAPVMEHLVPRMKMGLFAQMAKFELERLGPDATLQQTRDALGKAWDSVDNRLGQLVYDNLFWSRTTKDIAMASVRSVGWNLGTMRELGGGLIDYGKFAKDALTPGKKAEFTHRMSYVIALPAMAGIMGAITQYVLTGGDGPSEIKDYFFPRDGGKDEHGDATRISLPGYMKDVYAYYNDVHRSLTIGGSPFTTVGHKLHPALAMMAEMLNNRDYYGTKIRNEDDPLIQQLSDVAAYGLKSFRPFAVQGLMRNIETGGSSLKSFAPFIGITPAPKSINETRAQGLLSKYVEEGLPQGARNKKDAERSQLKYQIIREIQQGNAKSAHDKFLEGKKEGVLAPGDFGKIHEQAAKPQMAERFKHLTLEKAMNVYEVATPEERRDLYAVLVNKRENAKPENYPSAQFHDLRVRYRELIHLPRVRHERVVRPSAGLPVATQAVAGN